MSDAKVIPFERRRTSPARPLLVPASLFRGRDEPPFVLFDGTGKPAAPEDEEVLRVSLGDRPALRAYLQRYLPAIGRDTSVPAADRAWMLRCLLLDEADEVLERRHGGVDARRLMTIATQLAHFALERRDTCEFIDDVGGAPYELSHHATDTALLAVALAVVDGVTNVALLKALVVAGIYADVGKLDLPKGLLAQREPLNTDQWQLMRRHPQRSMELMRLALRAPVAERAVLQHHERLDGSGYPQQLHGAQISVEGRYIGLADAFAALSVERPFALGRRPYEAVGELTNRSDQYDARLLRHLVQLLAAPATAHASTVDGSAATST